MAHPGAKAICQPSGWRSQCTERGRLRPGVAAHAQARSGLEQRRRMARARHALGRNCRRSQECGDEVCTEERGRIRVRRPEPADEALRA